MSLIGKVLLDELALLLASVASSAVLDGVVLAAAEPLDPRVSSVINEGAASRFQRWVAASEAYRLDWDVSLRLDCQAW